MPSIPSASRKVQILLTRLPTTSLPNDSSPHLLHSIRSTQHNKTRPLPTHLPHELPLHILHTHAVPYPKKSENAASPTNSACIVLTQITRFRTVHVFKDPLKRATANNVLTFTPCPPHPPQRPPLLPLSFPARETPHLRAPSDRITEGYHCGHFVNFVA